MKKFISIILSICVIMSATSAYAAPEDNFEYIDYPGTKYIFGAKNGFVFNMLDGTKIYLDEYGNETDDIVGVMGTNIIFSDGEPLMQTAKLLDNNNRLITQLSTNDYELEERDKYIITSKLTDPLETRIITIYAKEDGSIIAQLPAKDYIIGNTFYGPPEYGLMYWNVSLNGYFVFADKNGLCGISDIKGNIMLEPKFNHLTLCHYEKDLFKTKTDNGVAIIDKNGNMLKEINAETVGIADHTEPGYIIQYYASQKNGAQLPLDKDFEKLDFFDETYSYLWSLNNDHFVVTYADFYERPKMLMGVMNYLGEIVVPLEYEYIEKVDHQRMKMQKSDSAYMSLAYFDGTVIEDNCNYITPVGDNGYIGISKDSFEGYIDQFNTRVITLPNGYFVQGPFSEGKAAIRDDWNAAFGINGGSTVYINQNGNVVLNDNSQEWYKGERFKNNLAFVASHLGKSGASDWLLVKYTGDTPSDWAKESVKAAIDNELLPIGAPYYLDSLYKEDITREEFCVIAVRIIQNVSDKILNYTPPAFTDTDNRSVFALYNAGIIDGKSKTQFAPKDLITREESAKILNGVCKYLNIKLPQTNSYTFADDADISDWAKQSVYNVNAADIMWGVGNDKFFPHGNYTREQAIATLIRIYRLSSTTEVVHFETAMDFDKEKNINGFEVKISRDKDNVLSISGENTEYLNNVLLKYLNNDGLVFGFSLCDTVMFQTEELSKLMWDISNIRYDGEILQNDTKKANEHIKIAINGKPALITKITQGKGSGHTDFYLHFDIPTEIKNIQSLDIICK